MIREEVEGNECDTGFGETMRGLENNEDYEKDEWVYHFKGAALGSKGVKNY